jgi:hypothetical protein
MAETTQTCSICGVQILTGCAGGDRVLFSSGPQGTRAKLWARVCQYTKQSGCINTQGANEKVTADDYYKPDVNTGNL